MAALPRTAPACASPPAGERNCLAAFPICTLAEGKERHQRLACCVLPHTPHDESSHNGGEQIEAKGHERAMNPWPLVRHPRPKHASLTAHPWWYYPLGVTNGNHFWPPRPCCHRSHPCHQDTCPYKAPGASLQAHELPVPAIGRYQPARPPGPSTPLLALNQP